MSDTVENSTDLAGAVSDTNDAGLKNMSENTVEIDLNSSEMTQKHIKFFHKSSFACSLCDTPNDEKSRPLVQFCEIDYLSQLQNKNLRFNRKSAQSVDRREKSVSVSGKLGEGTLNQNARQSGEPHLLEAASSQNARQSGEPRLLEAASIQNERQSGEPQLLKATSSQNVRQSGEPHPLEAASSQNARQSGEPHLLEAASSQTVRQSGEPHLLEAASIQNARQSGEPHLLEAASSQNVRQSGEPHLLEAASIQNARQSREPHLLEAASSQNARQSGEPHLLEAASLKSSVTEPTEADASANQPSKGPDNEVIGLVSELPKENDSELNGLVISISKNNSTDFIESNDLRSNEIAKAWKEGDDCVAKWSEDGQWYKSIIAEVDDDQVKVTFTEYGNCGWTSKELLMSPDTIIDENGQIIEKKVNENRKKQTEDKDKVCEEAKPWKENDKCVAQWVEDGCWYRSVIEKIESPDKVLVKFIDYGNSDFTSLSNIQPFETVIDVNGQIDNFHLNDNVQVENKDVLNEEVKEWKEGDKCVAQWVDDSCWYRSIIEKIESPDKVLVKFIDYGNSDYTILSNLKHCDTIIGEDGQIRDIAINEKNVEKGNQVSAIDTGEDKPVHKVEEVDLIGGMENFWKEGDACVAQWKEDDLWYRSVITKIESNGKVLVTFTDYGNSEYTSLEALKPAEDGPIEEVNDGIDVAWEVEDECVAQWEEDKYWYKSKIVRIDSIEKVLVEFTEYGNTDYTTLAKLKPFDTEIVNGQLKVATEADEKDIDELEEKSKTNEKCLWKKGDICLAQWSGDQCWYKSVIVLIENDGQTLVKFIEYGNLDYTTLSNLRSFETKTPVCSQAESHDTSVDHDEKALDSTAQDVQATSDCLQMETGKADSSALTTNDVSSKWKVGDSCVAQWRLDGYWYKSIITKLKSSGKVKVLFTEYGNSDYTSIDLLKPPETVIGVDGTLADETSSGVIHNKSMKLEPIAEEPLEGDAFKGNENEEEQKMSEGTILIAVTNNKEKDTFCGTGTLETKLNIEAIEIAADISNNNVDVMKEEKDRNDQVEPKNQEEMLAPNTDNDLKGVVAPEIETNTPIQSSLMNTDTLLLESITEINSSELVNEIEKIEIKNSTEKPSKTYPTVSPNESMSKSFDGETTNELFINKAEERTTKSMSEIDAGETNHTKSPDECNFTVTSKTKMDFVNHLTKNTVGVTSVNENQTDGNASFGLIDSLLKKSDAGDDHLDSAPESLANNSESIFHGKVRSLAMHEEGSKYLVAVTNQDTVVKIQEELITDPLSVMLHPVASKVMQAVIDVTDNLEELLEIVLENFYTLSSDKDGSKTIQKILTRLPCAQKSDIVAKLENEEVLKNLLSSQHGTNVAQACLPYLTEGSVTCVGNYLLGNMVELGSSPNGSYFLQLFMTSSNPTIIKVFKDKVLDAIVENADHLVKDKFGTWLAQTAAKVISSPRHILLFSAWVKDNIMDVYCDPDAMHFASSVIEALVKISNTEETDFDVNSSKRESEKILREVIFLMTDTLVEVNGGSVPLIVASSIDPYGHVLAREVCLQARTIPLDVWFSRDCKNFFRNSVRLLFLRGKKYNTTTNVLIVLCHCYASKVNEN